MVTAVPVTGGVIVVLVTIREMLLSKESLGVSGELVLFTLSLISDAATRRANSPVGTLDVIVEEVIAVVSTTVDEDDDVGVVVELMVDAGKDVMEADIGGA